MGNSNTVPLPTLKEFMLRGTPLVWDVSDVITWLKLIGIYTSQLEKCVLARTLDGECICETSRDLLQEWMCNGSHSISLKKFNQLYSFVEPLVQLDMVKLFATQPSLPIEFSISDHTPSSINDPIGIIEEFHHYTENSKDAGAPTLKRQWLYQPKSVRRYYGVSLEKLTLREPDAKIGSVLYHSMALSSLQSEDRKIMCPRSAYTKRVNPSSGGLHPVETYIIRTIKGRTELQHYSPVYHALETRYSLPITGIEGNGLHHEDFIVGLSLVQEREIWKYGPRGWRYSQLDVGHAIGALRIASSLIDYDVKVIDSSYFKNPFDILGLPKVETLSDVRELESPSVFLLFTPQIQDIEKKHIKFAQMISVMEFLSNQVSPECLRGSANVLFPRMEAPFVWPFVGAIGDASSTITQGDNVNRVLIPGNPSPTVSFGSDRILLKSAIRSRRSSGKFMGKKITQENLYNCLSAIVGKSNPLVNSTCNHYDKILTDTCSRSYSSIHFGLWITDIEDMKDGHYILFRGHSGNEEVKAEILAHLTLSKVDCDLFREFDLYLITSYDGERDDIKKEASLASCQQQIAKDCNLVVSMLAPLKEAISLEPRNYLHIHWECGFLGQMLYVQAHLEQTLGATGMGCFLDSPTKDIFQTTSLSPLYHFAIGVSSSDDRYPTITGEFD